eukprot:s1295_g15.t1
MAGKSWGEAIFGREALCLEVASRLCLSDLAAMLAVCADTAALFREAGASSVTVTEQRDDAVMMDLVCSALSASLSSGLLETLEGLVRSPQYGARPILCHAAASGRPDVVRWMLKNWSSARAFIEPSEPCGASPLHFAALGGHGHVCEVLLEEGGLDVDGRDNSGLRALHLAAEQGHVDACLSLLQCGAHPDGPRGLSDSSCGAPTPLLLAVECGHSEVCALLVTFRADPLASSLDGRTPLAVARKNALGAGSELLATLEAALWPNRARKTKAAAETAYVEESQPVLTGPHAQDMILRTMRRLR